MKSKLKPIRVGLLGLGTVGSGTVNILRNNAKEISRRSGRELVITRACCQDLSKSRDCDLSGIALTSDYKEVCRADDVDVVVELMGGEIEALEAVRAALQANKHVVTANKALVAKHGDEIFNLASAQGLMVMFEAAVAGAIPVIKSIREGLAANHIQWLAGIVNGTTNFILHQMQLKGFTFDEALKEAQLRGFAEADPTLDIEGIDAGHKLAILASIAFGFKLTFDNVYIQGVSAITSMDIEYADELGFRIKHLAIARRSSEGIELRVHPTLIPQNCLLANVGEENNAVLIQADAAGATLYYGAGAGSQPTASSVVADLVDVARAMATDSRHRVPYLAFQNDELTDFPLKPMGRIKTACYLRLHCVDKPGMLADVTQILGQLSIGIEAIIQKPHTHFSGMGQQVQEEVVPIIIVTHPVLEESMNQALAAMTKLDGVHDDILRLRIDPLDSDGSQLG